MTLTAIAAAGTLTFTARIEALSAAHGMNHSISVCIVSGTGYESFYLSRTLRIALEHSSLRRKGGRALRVKLRRRKPALLTALGSIPPDDRRQVQDSGGWQDDDAEKDLKESQTSIGQVLPARRCALEQQLLV